MVVRAITSFIVKNTEVQARNQDLKSGTAPSLRKVGDYNIGNLSERLVEPRP